MELPLLILVVVLQQLLYFDEGHLINTSVIPVGGDHITKDLSIILKTPTEQAERLNINMDMLFMMMHQMMNYLKYQ